MMEVQLEQFFGAINNPLTILIWWSRKKVKEAC